MKYGSEYGYKLKTPYTDLFSCYLDHVNKLYQTFLRSNHIKTIFWCIFACYVDTIKSWTIGRY